MAHLQAFRASGRCTALPEDTQRTQIAVSDARQLSDHQRTNEVARALAD